MCFKCALIYLVESALLMNSSLKPEVVVYDAPLFSGRFFLKGCESSTPREFLSLRITIGTFFCFCLKSPVIKEGVNNILGFRNNVWLAKRLA